MTMKHAAVVALLLALCVFGTVRSEEDQFELSSEETESSEYFDPIVEPMLDLSYHPYGYNHLAYDPLLHPALRSTYVPTYANLASAHATLQAVNSATLNAQHVAMQHHMEAEIASRQHIAAAAASAAHSQAVAEQAIAQIQTQGEARAAAEAKRIEGEVVSTINTERTNAENQLRSTADATKADLTQTSQNLHQQLNNHQTEIKTEHEQLQTARRITQTDLDHARAALAAEEAKLRADEARLEQQRRQLNADVKAAKNQLFNEASHVEHERAALASDMKRARQTQIDLLTQQVESTRLLPSQLAMLSPEERKALTI